MASNTDPSRHLSFWVNTVTFLVEDCLFRLPREPFQLESRFFCDKFSSLQGDGGETEGLSDEKPIRLDDVEKGDFEQLLKVLFHRTLTSLPDLSLSTDQWASVLKLSTEWSFQEPRQAAIDALTREASAVDRVVLSQKYNVEELFLPALNELVRRPDLITMEEAVQMGLDIGFKLASVREKVAVRKANCMGNRGKRNAVKPEGLGSMPPSSPMPNRSGKGASRLQDMDFSDEIRVTFGLPVGPLMAPGRLDDSF
ncbi:hypothetical protein EDD16DRAFT_1609067 [Pisolithus croceorrhizus]|nr:hypothetical protein EV401DRAFT_1997601 [Pisolithus croceorrhizus]KAI6110895.1 hypothetical protein EDD16DRAFT_1609067 [Pisolithus croceorrhizus]KAI6147626.1 hypothetical protein EDD17DRAFT_1648329 [Pisolithus thermaeus]